MTEILGEKITVLMAGGPGHGGWVQVPKGDTVIEIAMPPTQEEIAALMRPESDGMFLPPPRFRYTILRVDLFGRGLFIAVPALVSDDEKQAAIVSAVLQRDVLHHLIG